LVSSESNHTVAVFVNGLSFYTLTRTLPTEVPNASFLKYGTQKCASDASAVWANDPTLRVWIDG
jgi:hypothetical protein